MTLQNAVPGRGDDSPIRLARALELLELVDSDSEAASAAALELLAAEGEDEAAVVLGRVVGLSLRRSDLAAAVRALRSAVRLAVRLGLPARAGQARTSLLVLLANSGQTGAALRQAEIAEAELAQTLESESDLARLQVNLGLVLQRIGRDSEALSCYERAEPVLVRSGDRRWLELMLNLRGTLRAFRGDYEAGILDLRTALTHAESSDRREILVVIRQNLSFALLRAGRVPEALHEASEALRLATEQGRRADSALADRADVLLAAGLANEALEDAERALALRLVAGRALDVAESRQSAATAALAAGRVDHAAELAATARAEFADQGRRNWALDAWRLELTARYLTGERTAELLGELTQCTARLERAGWPVAPHQVRLQAAHTAAALGRRAQAVRLYQQVAVERFSGMWSLQLLAWEAECERRLLCGDRSGAGRAVTRGLSVLAHASGTIGSVGSRAGFGRPGSDLARAGLRLTLEGGSARSLLIRAEQWRAASLTSPLIRAPRSGQLSELMSRLRHLSAQLDDEARAGKDVRMLHRERVRLENEITELARHTPSSGVAPESPLDIRALSQALDGRSLVEYVRLDDELHAVVLADGRCSRHRIGSYRTVLEEFEHLRFAMRRLAVMHGPPQLRTAAQAAYDHSRASLDAILLDPLRRVDSESLVIVPTTTLHALAWPALPSLEGRTIMVAPSARSWLGAERAPARSGHVALAYAPDLPQAAAEIDALARLHPNAKALRGAEASAGAVADSWDGAGVAHVAAEVRVRTDNPLLSTFKLADGPLAFYNLESLGSAPSLMIISACDSALAGGRPGGEATLARTSLEQGSRSLIASVTPVTDARAAATMYKLHEGLNAGLGPASALAKAQADEPEPPAFLCFGSD